jgi:hypothetical protein
MCAIGNISMSTPLTHAKVYLRIFALSGFLWIAGIMAAMLEYDWLDYVLYCYVAYRDSLLLSITALVQKRKLN